MATPGRLAGASTAVMMAPAALSREALAAWLRLADTRGLSHPARAALLATEHSLEALFGSSHAALTAYVGSVAASALLAPPASDHARRVDTTLAWLDAPDQMLVTRRDPCYPATLAQLYDAPPLLYVKGRPALLQARAVAIVGSRDATPQGEADAAYFAGALAKAGLTVVSGLARGIDGAAHRGALTGPGSTVAVLGTGADLIYPARHRDLAHAIAEHGALVSEWPLGTPARAEHFPQRNRLIAAFSAGVLVIEAALRSGSLITARLANEMGRDVFALPGSTHAPLSRGCHALIREGAKLVETVEDILEEYGLSGSVRDADARNATMPSDSPADEARHVRKAPRTRSNVRAPAAASHTRTRPAAPPAPTQRLKADSRPTQHTLLPLSAEAQQVLDALGHAPVPLDLLVNRTGFGAAALHPLIFELELAGRIACLPGGRFARLDAGQVCLDAGVEATLTAAVLHSKTSSE